MSFLTELVGKTKTKMDGFVNAITSIGTSKDTAENFTYTAENQLAKKTLEDIYATDPIAWKLIDLLPDEATRKFIDINHEDSDVINKFLKDTKAKKKFNKALKREGLHGLSVIYMDIADGEALEEPVNENNIRSINALDVFECWYAYPRDLLRTGDSEIWVLQNGRGSHRLVHESRLLIFPGLDISDDWRIRQNGRGQNRIQRSYRPLLAYATSHGQIPRIVQDFIQGVVYLKGLNELFMDEDCDESDSEFKTRMSAMIYGRSVIKELVLDSEDRYEKSTSNVAGLNDLIRNPEKWLTASSGMPTQILLGETVGNSLSSDSKGQTNTWHKSISSYQEDFVSPNMDKLLRYVELWKNYDEEIKYTYFPLDEPTQKEVAEVNKIQSEADKNNLESKIVIVDEIRNSRYGDGYSLSTQLDDDMYQQSLNQEPPAEGSKEEPKAPKETEEKEVMSDGN